MKRAILKRILPITLAAALFATSMPVNVQAGQVNAGSTVSQNGDTEAQTAVQVQLENGGIVYAQGSGTTDIFTDTTITLSDLILKATYKDENNTSKVITMEENGNYELPYNADINMRLDFVLGTADAIDPNKTYTYQLPTSIRVDVEAVHELKDALGKSIGNVHISKEGTLTFQFYTDVIGTSQNTKFYVQFEGGLSEDLQESGKHADLNFPTATGDFKVSVDTTDSTQEEEKPEPGDMIIEKSGSRVISQGGKNYIEWTIALGSNGRDTIDGVIHDVLPAGLTYAEIAGYPKVEGKTWGNNGTVSTTAKEGDTTVDIVVSGCKEDYRLGVKFCTYYDDAFGSVIDNSTSSYIDNTAIFNPDDGTTGVTDDGAVYIKPDMLDKSGSSIADGYITWTVVLNRENLNLKGATYEDVLGEGMTLENVQDIEIEPALPAGSSISQTTNGFTVSFASGTDDTNTYIIKYKTAVDDFSQQSYKNTAKLKDGTDVTYNITQDASVPGLNLLDKSCYSFNSVTNTLTWTIEVNGSEVTMDNVVVTDTFDSTKMEFVSATVPLSSSSNTASGSLVFDLGTLTEKQVITVVTKIKDPDQYGENDWPCFRNNVSMISSLNPNVPVTDYADKYVHIEAPDLIDKDGKIGRTDNNGMNVTDGTIEWTVTIKAPQLTVNGMEFKDVLPDDMEYVPGSFKIMNMYYDPAPLYRDPVIGTEAGKQTISYTFSDADASEAAFYTKAFWIVYKTRVTDMSKAETSTSYTNHAEISVDYEGDVTVTDEAEKTVEGVVGGVFNKTFEYKPGNQYVDWTIAINEAHNDMSQITNPKIYDQLADYFDYVDGKLYIVDDAGNETEVAKADYLVSVVNGKLIVQLPNIGSDCYRFKFRTNFNCLAAELDGKIITNTANFVGDGATYIKESNQIKNVSFSSSSAGAVIKREIRVMKVDKDTNAPLAGAEFELYLGTECIGEAVSNSDGWAIFTDLNSIMDYSIVLREVEAPDGYEIDGTGETVITDFTEDNLLTDTDGTKYYRIEIGNQNIITTQTGEIKIQKVNGEGTLLSGAQFGLYSAQSCTEASRLYTRTTVDGYASFSGLGEGTYYLKEIASPAGYKVSADVITVELNIVNGQMVVTYDGTEEDTHEIIDEKAVGKLTITKKEKDASALLQGASFSIYKDALCTDRVASGSTNSSGVVTFDNLELGRTYYYRETTAPAGYVLDTTVHEITIGTGAEVTDQIENVTIENEKAVGNIVIHKVDNSTSPKSLSGVKFVLYQADGTTPYEKTAGVPYEVTTDSSGVAVFTDIPFGSYIINEPDGIEGYRINVANTSVTVNALGDKDVTIVNDLIKCDIKVVKRDNDGNTPLSGAEIGLYTDKGIQVKRGVTDDSGEVVFYDIPYGNYELRELKAPDGYNMTSATIAIGGADFNSGVATQNVITRTFFNDKQKGKIQLKKVDAANTNLALSGAEFTLYDENMLSVKTAVSLDVDQANAAGTDVGAVLFEDLAYGTYYVQETKAPDKYLRDDTIYRVVVDSDTVVTEYTQEDGTTGNLIITNEVFTTPFISMKVKKTDGEDGSPLADATFELYKDGVATGVTAVTGSDGIAYFKRISIKDDPDTSVYTLVEKSAPTGYIKSDTVISLGVKTAMNYYADFENDADALTDDQIKWAGETEAKATVENEPMKGSIWITKTGATSSTLLANTEFTLYKEDKTTLVTGTGITNPVTTNANGIAVFANLPRGVYYVKETKAPKGYTLNATETKVVIVDDSNINVTYKDTPINVSVSKRAVGGNEEIAGAVFKVVKKSDPSKTIDTWTSTNISHRVTTGALEIGETYILSEVTAPAGYGYISDIEFKVNNDGSISTAGEKDGQTIIVRDEPITLAVSKQDKDNLGAELPGALLAIYDDQQQEIYRFTSNLIPEQIPFGILTAPKTGYNEYTLKEISAPDGYDLAENIVFAVGTDGTVYKVTNTGGVKSYTPVTDNILVMEDSEKLPTDMYIRKLDSKTGLDVAGAEFAIYDEDDLTTAIVSWTSAGVPYKLDNTIFDTSKTYVLVEEGAPQGYLVSDPIKFNIDATTREINIVTGSSDNINGDKDTIMVRDKALELKIRKQDSFGVILKGATMKLSEYNTATQKAGAEVATFESDGLSVYTVLPSGLKSDTTYILQELDAPDGYKMAEDIIFTIAPDGKITRQDGVPVYNNTIVMEDDEAGLGIGKITLENQQGLAGSKLTLTSVDDPYFTPQTWVSDGHVKTWDLTDFNPGCTYILTEEEAPGGYAYADPIIFTIDKDDHQIYIDGQKVDNRTVHIADGKLSLMVSKQDFYDQTEIPGAELAILDAQGQVVASWVSGVAAIAVDTSKLLAGKDDTYQEYTLREIKAPVGYKKAADITFAIDKDGKIYLVTENDAQIKSYKAVEGNHLIMYDEPMLTVNKLDTSGNPVEGAKLTITAKDDDSFTPITWVTTKEPYAFEDGTFTPGVTYVLTEEEAPGGYAYAESIEFQVDDDDNLYVKGQLVENKRIVMLDYPIKVYISKLDAGSRQGLAGAKLVIKNEQGEVIHSFISTNEPTLLPTEMYEAMKRGEMKYYTLSELEAPGGYSVAKDIAFAVDSDGNLYLKNDQGQYVLYDKDTIEMLDTYNGGSGGNGNPNFKGPKTGDDTPLGWLIALCIAGFAGICTTFGMYFYRKRKIK